MNLKKQQRILVIISIILLILLFIFYKNIQNEAPNIVEKYLKNFHNTSIQLKKENFDKNRELKTLNVSYNTSQLIFKSNRQWIVNKHVLQYSAYVIFKRNSIKIESLVFLNLGNNGNLNCFVTDSKFQTLIRLPVITNLEIIQPVHKITCEWPNSTFNLDTDVMVAIVFDDDFDFESKLKDHNNTEKLSYEVIQFHLAKKFNANKAKKQSIAHCVHMFYGVDDIKSNSLLKFINWVELQRNIGIDRMRIYVLKLDKNTFDYLNEKYKNFINFVDHPTTFEPICGWIEAFKEANQNSTVYDMLLKNCQNAFNKVFLPIKGWFKNFFYIFLNFHF
jgi:hypothetical protein